MSIALDFVIQLHIVLVSFCQVMDIFDKFPTV